MPIYAYRCTACGHEQDVLQKISDPTLTVCPACSQSTYAKQVTAAGFQLKGSGWYVTDFRNGSSTTSVAPAGAAKPATSDESSSAKSAGSTDAGSSGAAGSATSGSTGGSTGGSTSGPTTGSSGAGSAPAGAA